MQEAAAGIMSNKEFDQLVLENLGQVQLIAQRVSNKIPVCVELSDLVSVGILGLMEAIKKFNPQYGVRFKTYAEHRIRGAMLDSLRSLDWAPRKLRSDSRKMKTVFEALEQSLGRAATDEEKSEALDIGIDEYHRLMEKIARVRFESLDIMPGENDPPTPSPYEVLPDLPHCRPYSIFKKNETRDFIARAIQKLPKRERIIISLYYYEELTMHEIGKVLGVNESRVSQMHGNALRRLSGKLRPLN
jgi:RNA polymerase sigma factor for flagellar operon FliA